MGPTSDAHITAQQGLLGSVNGLDDGKKASVRHSGNASDSKGATCLLVYGYGASQDGAVQSGLSQYCGSSQSC